MRLAPANTKDSYRHQQHWWSFLIVYMQQVIRPNPNQPKHVRSIMLCGQAVQQRQQPQAHTLPISQLTTARDLAILTLVKTPQRDLCMRSPATIVKGALEAKQHSFPAQ
jgi:hypothetical protein